MKQNTMVPLLVYDGECSFCRLWVERWKGLTGGRVRYAPFQEVANDFPKIPLEKFEQSVQLIVPSGDVFSGAHAAFQALAYAPGKGWMLWIYKYVPGFSAVSEWFYRLIAAHRPFFYKLTRLLWGKHVGRSSYVLARWIFLRLLGIIYFIAFISLWIQITGLVGGSGILPENNFLNAVKDNIGVKGFWYVPTLAWLSASNGFLEFLTLSGALLSLFVVAGVLVAPVLAVLWVFYLSLFSVGQVFLSFQWDILLLEVGFLAVFLAPLQVLPRLSRVSPPSSLVVWLFHFLLFRLIFGSGVVKLASGDPTWRNLTALNFHYFTQPLPNPIAWYVHQLPVWFQKVSVAGTFAVELFVPFLIFAPRRLRFFAAFSIISLETFILLTGNYTFFTILTIALCLLLLDDAFLQRFLPKKLGKSFSETLARLQRSSKRTFRAFIILLAIVIIVAGSIRIIGLFSPLPKPTVQFLNALAPLRIVNSYGLFAVMTTSRSEIIVEGSRDGETWLEYEFKYKPGDVKRAPPWVAPHQPRLDWQMWFAALDNYQQNPWFTNFMIRLLQGSPEVTRLLEKNPFPVTPPRYIRASLYDYTFTDFETKRTTGAWWRRELKGLYFPVASLEGV